MCFQCQVTSSLWAEAASLTVVIVSRFSFAFTQLLHLSVQPDVPGAVADGSELKKRGKEAKLLCNDVTAGVQKMLPESDTSCLDDDVHKRERSGRREKAGKEGTDCRKKSQRRVGQEISGSATGLLFFCIKHHHHHTCYLNRFPSPCSQGFDASATSRLSFHLSLDVYFLQGNQTVVLQSGSSIISSHIHTSHLIHCLLLLLWHPFCQ